MQSELHPLLLQWKAPNSWAGSYQQEKNHDNVLMPWESFIFLKMSRSPEWILLAGSQDLLHTQGSTWWVGDFALQQVKYVSCFVISYAKFGCTPGEMIEMVSVPTFLSADDQGLPPALWCDLPEVWEVVEHEFPKMLEEPDILQWELNKIQLFFSRQIKFLPGRTMVIGGGLVSLIMTHKPSSSLPSCDV